MKAQWSVRLTELAAARTSVSSLVARRFSLVVMLTFVLSEAVPAQGVRVQVRGSADGGAGILVQLRDTAGGLAARGITDSEGRVFLTAPRAGRYTLRVLRIGFRPSNDAPFEITQGSITTRTVAVGTVITQLPAVSVAETRRCAALTDSSSAGYPIWEEARNALESSLLTRQASGRELSFTTSTFVRHYAADGTLNGLDEREEEAALARPFQALEQVRLAGNGFVSRDSTGVVFAAPDEAVLLSDGFAAGHCISAVIAGSSDSVTLAFVPVPDSRTGDIAGTIVLDRASHALRAVSFRYVNIESAEIEAGAGGELGFARLPGGQWLVRDWELRFPIIRALQLVESPSTSTMSMHAVVTSSQARPRMVGVQEVGGHILAIRDGQHTLYRSAGVALSGVVEDSSGKPLHGANVRIRGSGRSALTDTAGRFSLTEVTPGPHLLLLTPPFADSLDVQSTMAIASTESAPNSVVGRTATRVAALSQACPGLAQGTGYVRGVTRDAHGARLPGGEVVAVWNAATSADPSWLSLSTVSGPTGDFRLCGIPLAVPVVLDASATDNRGGRSTFALDRATRVALVDVVLR